MCTGFDIGTFLCRQKSSAKNLSELDFRSLINCNVRPVGQANSLRSNKACLVTVSLTFIAHSNRLGKEQSRALFEARSASCEAKECGLARYSHSIWTPEGRRIPAWFLFLWGTFFFFTSQTKKKKVPKQNWNLKDT